MRIAVIVCLGLGLGAGVALPASADGLNNGLYLELQGGATFWQDADLSVSGIGSGEVKFDNGWNAGASIGFRIFEMLRLEANASLRAVEIDELNVGPVMLSGEGFAGAGALLGNAYFDIPIPLPIKPYVGGGMGVAIFSADATDDSVQLDNDDTEFAWNVMGGVFVPLFRHLELDARYRYITSNDPEIDADLFGFTGTAKAEFEAHEVLGAIRVVF